MEIKTILKIESENKNIMLFIVYLILFYLVWTLKELWLVDYIQYLNETISAVLSAIIKILVWIVPACLYINYYLHFRPVDYLKLNVNVKIGLFWGIFLSFLLGLYFWFKIYVLNNQVYDFSLSIHSFLNTFLLVGITEEIVFRGFILQMIMKKITFWKANLITAILFLWIHSPIWIYSGTFFDLWGQLYVFVIGLLFGYLFYKTGSLWTVVIIHSFHNFFLIVM